MEKGARKIQISKLNKQHSRAGFILTIIILAIAFIVCFFLLLLKNPASNSNTALIHINGIILSGHGPGYNDGNTYSDEVSNLLEQILKSKNIKAIIFEINSPGGSAVASAEISKEIKQAKASGKLTVALIREQGTSGAYWIASSCDHIVSHQLSVTGSIGVLASYLEFSGLLEKFNITYENLNAGKYKDALSPYRALTEEERVLLQNKVNLVYSTFIKEVAQNRNLSEEKIKTLANGIFYLGEEAKQLDLIDEFGNMDEAIKYIEQKEKIKIKIKEYSPVNSLLSGLYGLQDKAFFMIGRGLGSSLFNQNSLSIRA